MASRMAMVLGNMSVVAAAQAGHMSIMTFYDLNSSAQCGWTTHAWTEVGDDGQSFKKPLPAALQDSDAAISRDLCSTQGWVMMPRDIWDYYGDYTGKIRNFTATIKPWVQNGTISGVVLGDELRMPRDEMEKGLATLREGLGKDVLLYTNEAYGTLNEWPDIPAELDLVSFDYYDPGNFDGLLEFQQNKDWAEQVVFPKFNHSGQKLVLCPGIYGNSPDVCESNGLPCPLDAQQSEIVKKLDALFKWAKQEERIAGFNPWHFGWREFYQHPDPWDMRMGAVQMPEVLSKLKEIGTFIRGTAERGIHV